MSSKSLTRFILSDTWIFINSKRPGCTVCSVSPGQGTETALLFLCFGKQGGETQRANIGRQCAFPAHQGGAPIREQSQEVK